MPSAATPILFSAVQRTSSCRSHRGGQILVMVVVIKTIRAGAFATANNGNGRVMLITIGVVDESFRRTFVTNQGGPE